MEFRNTKPLSTEFAMFPSLCLTAFVPVYRATREKFDYQRLFPRGSHYRAHLVVLVHSIHNTITPQSHILRLHIRGKEGQEDGSEDGKYTIGSSAKLQ